jgi:transposase
LLRHGLIQKSFVPPKSIRELRDLVRYRRKLVQSRSTERNRLLKLLETANIKLSSVIANVFGVSGMAMLRALLEGKSSAVEMAQLARKRMRQKLGALELALEGRVEEHHRFLLRMQLDRLSQVDAHITEIDKRIEQQLEPYQQQRRLISEIPGIDRVVAAEILAETGVDMTVFKSGASLASWAGVCPGNNESAGRSRSGRHRTGNIHLTTALVEAAQAAVAKKGSYFRDKFFRIKARRGYKRALLAIAHKILLAAYRMLSSGTEYRDLGETYLDQIDHRRTTRNLVRRLERLGYRVQIEANAA